MKIVFLSIIYSFNQLIVAALVNWKIKLLEINLFLDDFINLKFGFVVFFFFIAHNHMKKTTYISKYTVIMTC